MWAGSSVQKEDLEQICASGFIPWERLKQKTILVTGATGLIGYALTSALLHFDLVHDGQVKVIALVRSKQKGIEKFSDWLDAGAKLEFLEGAVEEAHDILGPVDYILHCAAPTTSAYFIEHPVETIHTIYAGTKNVLELAKEKRSSGTVFLSSMEVYGQVTARDKLCEADLGHLDLSSVRSSYSEGKRLAENLCCAYAAQYDVPVTIARLAQTFGPGVDRNDSRVFAYMARCALAGKDIRLSTDGSKENMYLYTMDAVSAILLLLFKGERGAAYNVANESTYCSIKEMGELVGKTLSESGINVITGVERKTDGQYRPAGYLNLDTSKLKELGWSARIGLTEMYLRTFGGQRE